MASVMCLQFCMQEEDILEHSNGKWHLSVDFSQLVDHCVTWHASHNIIQHTHVKIVVMTLECQVS